MTHIPYHIESLDNLVSDEKRLVQLRGVLDFLSTHPTLYLQSYYGMTDLIEGVESRDPKCLLGWVRQLYYDRFVDLRSLVYDVISTSTDIEDLSPIYDGRFAGIFLSNDSNYLQDVMRALKPYIMKCWGIKDKGGVLERHPRY